jgi:hypothetical protein
VPFFVVKDGTNTVHLQGFLVAGQVQAPVAVYKVGNDGLLTGIVYVIEDFRLANAPWLVFDVQGFNVNRQSNVASTGQRLATPAAISIQVEAAGTGFLGASPAIVQGTIRGSRVGILEREDWQPQGSLENVSGN